MKAPEALLLFAVLEFFLCSCSIRNIMVDQAAGIVEDGMAAFEKDDDLRMLEEALPASIKLSEAFLVQRPDNRRMLTLLSRMYGSYTFAFVEEKLDAALLLDSEKKTTDAAELRERVNRYYLQGAQYARKALAVSLPDVCPEEPGLGEACLQAVTAADLHALFWYGFNLGTYVNRNRESYEAVSRIRPALEAMRRVLEIEPGYFHGGAHLFFMAYYAALPAHMGGDPGKSREHYEKLRQLTGEDFLLTGVFYARFYLIAKGNRQEFTRVLEEIRNAPESRMSAFPLFNRIAVRRAEIYLRGAERLFSGSGP